MSTKVHMADMRLYNNAGMLYPVCRVGDDLLDTEFPEAVTRVRTLVNCEVCKCAWNTIYDWAEPFRASEHMKESR